MTPCWANRALFFTQTTLSLERVRTRLFWGQLRKSYGNETKGFARKQGLFVRLFGLAESTNDPFFGSQFFGFFARCPIMRHVG